MIIAIMIITIITNVIVAIVMIFVFKNLFMVNLSSHAYRYYYLFVIN